MADNTDKYLVWVDIETFGLGATDPILEIGVRVTDLDLETVASANELVWGPTYREHLDSCDPWVKETHTKNGLFEAASKFGNRTTIVDKDLASFLSVQFSRLGIKKPAWTGSSVHFDEPRVALFLPSVHKLFSYRHTDVSTLKELCRRYNPDLFAKLGTSPDYPEPAMKHRTYPDLTDSVNEFRFYRDNFIFDGR